MLRGLRYSPADGRRAVVGEAAVTHTCASWAPKTPRARGHSIVARSRGANLLEDPRAVDRLRFAVEVRNASGVALAELAAADAPAVVAVQAATIETVPKSQQPATRASGPTPTPACSPAVPGVGRLAGPAARRLLADHPRGRRCRLVAPAPRKRGPGSQPAASTGVAARRSHRGCWGVSPCIADHSWAVGSRAAIRHARAIRVSVSMG